MSAIALRWRNAETHCLDFLDLSLEFFVLCLIFYIFSACSDTYGIGFCFLSGWWRRALLKILGLGMRVGGTGRCVMRHDGKDEERSRPQQLAVLCIF